MQLEFYTLLGGFALSVAASLVVGSLADKPKIRARCTLDPKHSSGPRGEIDVESYGRLQTRVTCRLTGLTPGLHGLHVHACNDLSRGCASTCDHYNPDGCTHGGPMGSNRHRGDFGNVLADAYGHCRSVVIADVRVEEILNRTFVIHAGEDDLGKGGDSESLKTGNAGKRIACGIILPEA